MPPLFRKWRVRREREHLRYQSLTIGLASTLVNDPLREAGRAYQLGDCRR
jgi:hypothetical protein